MNFAEILTFFYILIFVDTIWCSRQHRIQKKFTNGMLSRYITKQGRLHFQHQKSQSITDDEDLLNYEPGSGANDMQGDATRSENILDIEDVRVQRVVCCTLGRASSSHLRDSSCSARAYVRIVKLSMRQKRISEQLGLNSISDISDTAADTYKCVLKHKSTFEKCCLASKVKSLHHKQSRLNHKERIYYRKHDRSNRRF